MWSISTRPPAPGSNCFSIASRVESGRREWASPILTAFGTSRFAFPISTAWPSDSRPPASSSSSAVHRVPTSQVTYAGGAQKRLVYFRDPEGNLLELCEYR